MSVGVRGSKILDGLWWKQRRCHWRPNCAPESC